MSKVIAKLWLDLWLFLKSHPEKEKVELDFEQGCRPPPGSLSGMTGNLALWGVMSRLHPNTNSLDSRFFLDSVATYQAQHRKWTCTELPSAIIIGYIQETTHIGFT